MRSRMAEKDLEIEEHKLNISSLEQKLLDEGLNEKIINDLRVSIQTVATERDSKANVGSLKSFHPSTYLFLWNSTNIKIALELFILLKTL